MRVDEPQRPLPWQLILPMSVADVTVCVCVRVLGGGGLVGIQSKGGWKRIWLQRLFLFVLSSLLCLFEMTLTPTILAADTLKLDVLHFHRETKRGFLFDPWTPVSSSS